MENGALLVAALVVVAAVLIAATMAAQALLVALSPLMHALGQ